MYFWVFFLEHGWTQEPFICSFYSKMRTRLELMTLATDTKDRQWTLLMCRVLNNIHSFTTFIRASGNALRSLNFIRVDRGRAAQSGADCPCPCCWKKSSLTPRKCHTRRYTRSHPDTSVKWLTKSVIPRSVLYFRVQIRKWQRFIVNWLADWKKKRRKSPNSPTKVTFSPWWRQHVDLLKTTYVEFSGFSRWSSSTYLFTKN